MICSVRCAEAAVARAKEEAAAQQKKEEAALARAAAAKAPKAVPAAAGERSDRELLFSSRRTCCCPFLGPICARRVPRTRFRSHAPASLSLLCAEAPATVSVGDNAAEAQAWIDAWKAQSAQAGKDLVTK